MQIIFMTNIVAIYLNAAVETLELVRNDYTSIHNIPGMFQRVRQSTHLLTEACITVKVQYINYLL
jgi:ethanolamine utilization cobalamin adenosyltransferase